MEQAQPGDRCDFTGTLIVIPDVSQLALPGAAKAESSAHHRGEQGYDAEGLRGLKGLGVRDLTYKMAFMACTVVPSNPRVKRIRYCFIQIYLSFFDYIYTVYKVYIRYMFSLAAKTSVMKK